LNVERLYLDYNATSPPSSSVLDWLKGGDFLFANPASQHSSGKASRKIINETRTLLFKTFNQSEKESHLLFHSGATEGIMTFAYSFSEWARQTGKDLLICYSKLDHPAVTSLSERFLGSQVSYFELKMDQKLNYLHQDNFEFIQDKKDNNPNLIILYHHLWVHNETGIVSPLENLMNFKKIPDLYLHIDAVQVPGKISNWKSLAIGDMFTFSAHKFGAIKGIGFSFFAKSISFYPLIRGGGQQSSLRSGTENIMGIQSISLALKDLTHVDVKASEAQRMNLEAFLKEELAGIGGIISEIGSIRNSNTIYFYLDNLSSDIALALFDLHGVEISAGSACSSGASKASVLMTHLGFKEKAKNGLRISLPFQLSEQEIEKIKGRFKIVLEKLRA
jgi:cysteine desulfurase